MRDPRWGRNQETYGEDPYLTGELAKSFVKGLRGSDKRFIRVNGGCKHFDAYNGPENIPVSRFSFDAKVSDIDWRMTYLPAFKKCVEAETYSMMCSYNSLNGIPTCANKQLLTDVLRNEWGFKGYVVSDEGAIENIISQHHYINDSVNTVAACVNAGVNLELSENLADPVFMSLVQAVNESKLSESLVRERVKPLFYTRMRLGEFDPPQGNPWSSLDSSVAESAEHQQLAIEAAMNSFVLLKNSQDFLPVPLETYKSAAFFGPMINEAQQLFGDYSASQSPVFTKTPLDGISSVFENYMYSYPCQDVTPCKNYNASATIPPNIHDANVIFLCLGTGQILESESRDRADMELPGHQKDLILDTIKYAGHKPIVLLLFSGGPLNISVAVESESVLAIVQCFFPAQATGDALVKIVTSRNRTAFSPAGRLPFTWPLLSSQIPSMVNYSMQDRTYRYSQSTPLFPFGYGLSFTTFKYSGFSFPNEIQANEKFEVYFILMNTGTVDSDEVVQCYVSWEDQTLPVPIRQLAYFNRTFVRAGEKVQITANIPWETVAFWQSEQWTIPKGVLNVYCGGQQPFQKVKAPSNILEGKVTITTSLKTKSL